MNANSSQPNPYAPPSAKVEDTVDTTEIDMAGRGVRLAAIIVDTLIFFVVVYVPLLIAIGSNIVTVIQNPQSIVGLLPQLGIAGIISSLGLIILATVTIVLVKRNGQTIAKRLLGIKVVRSDGSPASLGRIFWLRNFIGLLISLIPQVGRLWGLIDALFIFGNKRQCLHDKIADTIVVNARL